MKSMIVTAWCRMVQDADLVLQLFNLRNTSIVDTDLFFVFFFFLNKLIPTLDVALLDSAAHHIYGAGFFTV